MSIVKIQQGDLLATLDNLDYSPASGHIEDGTAYVIEETLSASCDVKLEDGDAVLSFGEESFPVTISVMEFDEDEKDEEDVIDDEEETPICEIMIDSPTGELEKLADALELR